MIVFRQRRWGSNVSLQAELEREQAQDNENARLVALIKASTLALKVRSGQEALDLIRVRTLRHQPWRDPVNPDLLPKASERSNEDLLLALEFPDQWDMKIIIREWVREPMRKASVTS